MNSLFLLLALCQTPSYDDGTLLFVANGNHIVQSQTVSTLTHVGILFNEGEELYFYEATPPVVKRTKFSEYVEELKKENKLPKHRKVPLLAWTVSPKVKMNEDQKKKMKVYLDAQLDKPYSIESYLFEEPGNGIHCCELVGDAWQFGGIKYTEKPYLDDPKSVWTKVKKDFKEPVELEIERKK